MMDVSKEVWLQLFGRLHPALLHVPIGALVALACLELAALLPRVPRLPGGVRGVLLALTTVSAIVTASSGWLLGEEFGYSEQAFVWHRALGIAFATTLTVATLAAAFGMGRTYGTLLVLALVLVVPTGHNGATLTHGADFLTEPLREAQPPEPEPADGPSSVAEASELTAESGTDGAPDSRDAPAVARSEPAAAPAGDDSVARAGSEAAYADTVAPILEARCGMCHSDRRQKGKLALHEPSALLAGGYSGPVLVPGDAAASELVRRIRLPLDDEEHMPPPSKPQPTEAEIAAIERWIDAGAPFGAAFDAPAETPDSPPASDESSPTDEAPTTDEASRSDAPGSATPKLAVPRPAPVAPVAALRAIHVHVETLDPTAELLWIDFAAVPAADDASAREHLEPLADFVLELSLAGTAITDALLPELAAMPRLERLDLGGTACTAEGLAALRAAPSLRSLNLTGLAIGDAALPALAGMPALRKVYLWDTGVTPGGLDDLARTRPELTVVNGMPGPDEPLETEAPPRLVATPSLDAVNTTCPVSGNPVDPRYQVVHEGKVVGFCCADCPARFWANPDAYPLGP